ncbi:MAG: IreB family regulatory phosphoprotein [Clostridia bacterium]|nr:IreB family regulatory phosphoprotein [Clostridia bacterium]
MTNQKNNTQAKSTTITFTLQQEKDREIRAALQSVYNSLKEKGYNPVNQIVGYILSEDPTYITNHNNARALIRRIDKYELMRALVQNYLVL